MPRQPARSAPDRCSNSLRIALADRGIMALAGLWENWHPDGSAREAPLRCLDRQRHPQKKEKRYLQPLPSRYGIRLYTVPESQAMVSDMILVLEKGTFP
jgi:hypothetical protein